MALWQSDPNLLTMLGEAWDKYGVERALEFSHRSHLVDPEVRLKKDLNSVLDHEESIFFQRARSQWINDRDHNTRDGHWSNDPYAIQEGVVTFFEDLFISDPNDGTLQLPRCNFIRLSDLESDHLRRNATEGLLEACIPRIMAIILHCLGFGADQIGWKENPKRRDNLLTNTEHCQRHMTLVEECDICNDGTEDVNHFVANVHDQCEFVTNWTDWSRVFVMLCWKLWRRLNLVLFDYEFVKKEEVESTSISYVQLLKDVMTILLVGANRSKARSYRRLEVESNCRDVVQCIHSYEILLSLVNRTSNNMVDGLATLLQGQRLGEVSFLVPLPEVREAVNREGILLSHLHIDPGS
ncbi:hypothetical protein GQ457_12G011850 [Hibiscus cannabinus]